MASQPADRVRRLNAAWWVEDALDPVRLIFKEFDSRLLGETAQREGLSAAIARDEILTHYSGRRSEQSYGVSVICTRRSLPAPPDTVNTRFHSRT